MNPLQTGVALFLQYPWPGVLNMSDPSPYLILRDQEIDMHRSTRMELTVLLKAGLGSVLRIYTTI